MGRALAQADIMPATLAMRMNATLMSTDRDLEAVSGLRTESWLPK